MLEVHPDRDKIWKCLQGSVGLRDSGVKQEGTENSEKGVAFEANFATTWGYEYTEHAPYVYDAVYLFSYALDQAVTEGEDFNDGITLVTRMR